MKLGLYTITYLGLWYQGPALTIEEAILRARRYGYDGLEIDGKRPHGNPLDLPSGRCVELGNARRIRGLKSTRSPRTTISAVRSRNIASRSCSTFAT